MFRFQRNYFAYSLLLAFAGFLAIALPASVQAQRKAAGDDEPPMFKEYRGVQLGMAAEDVRKKLGEPKDKSDEQDFFLFGESESLQIVYDKTGKVVTISADFLTSGNGIPTAKQLFGADIDAKPDGSMYKMVRYTKAGYWVSFNRTSGTSPLTTVTLQKIQ